MGKPVSQIHDRHSRRISARHATSRRFQSVVADCFRDSLETRADSAELSAGPRIRWFYRLLCNDQEELEVAKFVHPFIAAATIADLHGCALRQPHAELAFIELDWCIRNVEMLQLQQI